MTGSSSQATETDRWKEQYRMLLSEWETREQQWHKIESIVRRGINRLAVIAAGVDPAVDAQLEELRSTIRRDSELADVIEMLDAVAVTAARVARGRSVSDVQTPTDTRRDGTQAESSGDPSPGAHHEPAVDGPLPSPQSQGSNAKPADQLEQVSGMSSPRGFDLATQPEPHATFESALLAVFNVLPIPEDLRDSAQQIQRHLKAGIPVDEYPRFLDTVAKFSAETQSAIQQYINDMQRFLVGVTERLQEIDACLNQRMESVDQAVQQASALSESVQSELRGIALSAESIADIDNLKHAVQSRLKRIESLVTNHLDREKQHAKRSGQEIKRLLARLDELENEARQLRLQVSQARAEAAFDALTGLFNRVSFDARIAEQLDRCAVKGTGLALVLLDIDNFRALNESFGHQAGDRVLAALGKLLTEQSGYTDCAARLGADHFALLVADSDTGRASNLAKRVQQTFDRARFYHRGTQVPVTLSGAVTVFRSGDDAQSMIARAEHALHEAQRAGGNRVLIADTDHAAQVRPS